MSTLTVGIINTSNGTTNLALTTGNTNAGSLTVQSGGGFLIQSNSTTNALSSAANGDITLSANLAVTGGRITGNRLLSSDSNLEFKLDTTNRRQIFTVYGFDFELENGIITPINKTRYNYTHTGADQSLVVPAGVNYIFVKMWGGGGGGGSYGGWRQGSLGGAGGFSHGIIPVVPGETISIRVGGRGLAVPGSTNAYPDGGRASVSGTDNRYGGSGGGSSSIRVPSQSNSFVIVAGGGGGGGSVNGYELNSGGAGGGLIGECGVVNPINGNNNNGKGGTQAAGGAGGTGTINTGGSGASFQGGSGTNAAPYSGGGGGGYFGGGAGGYGTNSMGGGGGGSGFIRSGVIMGATYTGQQFIPPFYDDPDLANSSTERYAKGADEGGHGGHGYIILYY